MCLLSRFLTASEPNESEIEESVPSMKESTPEEEIKQKMEKSRRDQQLGRNCECEYWQEEWNQCIHCKKSSWSLSLGALQLNRHLLTYPKIKKLKAKGQQELVVVLKISNLDEDLQVASVVIYKYDRERVSKILCILKIALD